MQIDILMATYKGAKYIRQQIDSILEQTYQDWHLIIRDDGSDDETVTIIQSYMQRDKRIELVSDSEQKLGVARNFIHLLDYSHAPFAMYCDQDDVWFPEKVSMMLAAIEPYDQQIPQVLFSNAYLWNEQQGIISKQNTLTYPTNFRELLFLNTGIQGAASIFNHAATVVMRQKLDYYAMHDHVLVLTAIGLGQVHYLDKPLFYYRQHQNNVTGNAPGSLFKKVKLALSKNRHVPVVDAHHYKGVAAFYAVHKNALKREDQAIIENFLKLPSYHLMQRFYYILHLRYKIFNSSILLLTKMCIRPFFGSTTHKQDIK